MSEAETLISVIVCTRNRARILFDCLKSLTPEFQRGRYSAFEVLVVDNGSTDDTRGVVNQFCRAYDFFRHVFEPKIGLSHARNRGFSESKAPWVVYLDDDGKASPDFLVKCSEIISTEKFDMFGGHYAAWFREKRPKWLHSDFGNKPFVRGERGVLPDNGYISGGIMAIRRTVLEDIGGFDVNLGMRGSVISYGEEAKLQYDLKSAGYSLGFDPDWKIEHLVSKHKLKVNWHIRQAYAISRDVILYSKFSSSYRGSRWMIWIWVIKLFIKSFLISMRKWVRREDYYFQNLYIDSLVPVSKMIGENMGYRIKSRFNDNNDLLGC